MLNFGCERARARAPTQERLKFDGNGVYIRHERITGITNATQRGRVFEEVGFFCNFEGAGLEWIGLADDRHWLKWDLLDDFLLCCCW